MGTTVPRARLLLPLVVAAAAAACGHESSTAPSCTYSVSALSTSFQAPGGAGSVNVSTAARCSWTARADAGWLSIASGASGTGAGAVTFAVSANTDPTARAGTLTIAGQQVSIRQDGADLPCTYSISPVNASTGKDGGTGTLAVTAGATCPWTAESSASWLAVTAGGQGTGNATVAYSVSRNVDIDGRSATIRVAGQTFTLTQAGDVGNCQYSVAPFEFSPCMGSVEMASQVVTQAGCPWTAAPGASWITIATGQSGSGTGTVRFRISDNYDAPRSGIVMVRWPTPTEGQNVRIAQAGCYYGVSRNSFSLTGSGGTGTFDVVQQSEPYTCGGATQDACVWTAQSDAAWIAVTSSMPRRGDNPVSFSVAPNDGTAERSGTITVRDKAVRITQARR